MHRIAYEMRLWLMICIRLILLLLLLPSLSALLLLVDVDYHICQIVDLAAYTGLCT